MNTIKRLLSWQLGFLSLALAGVLIYEVTQANDVVPKPRIPGAKTPVTPGKEVVTKPKGDVSVLTDDRVTTLQKELRREIKALRTEIDALKAENAKQGIVIQNLMKPPVTKNRTAMWITKANWNRVDDSALMLFWVVPQ